MTNPIIITGVARGGTSLIASLCSAVGVPMGKAGPRYENPHLQRAAIVERWDVVALLVQAIEEEQETWGWKLPALVSHLDKVEAVIPNARFIFVTKDVVSVARRRADPADPQRFGRMIGRTARAYMNMASFATHTERPTHFISYEEVMRDPLSAAAGIAKFCGILQPDLSGILEQIAIDHAHYRTATVRPRAYPDLYRKLEKICENAGLVTGEEVPNTA